MCACLDCSWSLSDRPGAKVRDLKCDKHVSALQLINNTTLVTSSMDGKVGRSVCCLRHQYLPGCVEHVRSTCVHECVCNRCKVLLLSPLCLACTGQWPACKRCLQEACACAFTSKLTRSCVHTDARNTRIQYIHACPRKAGGHQPDAVWGNVC